MTERAPPKVVDVSVCIHCGRPDYAHDPSDEQAPKRMWPQLCPYCDQDSGKLYRYRLAPEKKKR